MVDYKLLAKVISALGEAPRGGEDMDIRISVALGDMQSGSAKLVRGGLPADLGRPPRADGQDWLAVVKKK